MTTCQSLRSQALQRQALRFQSQRFQSRRGQSLRCQSQCDPGRYDMTAGHLPELTSSSHRCTRCHRCHRCHRSFSQTDTMPDHLHDALGNTIRASESFNQPPISTVDQHIRSAHSISTFDQLIRSVQRMQSYVVAPPKVPNVHTHLRIGVPRNIVAPRHVRPTPSKPGVTAQPSPGIPAHIFGGAARTPRQPALSASLAAVT